MRCSGCQRENPEGASFCGGCGARLERVCAGCQTPNPPGNRFCHHCGGALQPGAAADQFASPRTYTPKHLAEKILTTGSALEGERKQVTVLFVDVSGLHVAVRAARSRRGPPADEPRLRPHAGRGPPLRGHGQPVPRRRHHGAVRRAHRPRGPRAPGRARRARHRAGARRLPATSWRRAASPSAPARA